MHIPSGDTALLELVTFQQALEAANTPSEEYDIQKWLYAPNFYCDYRYILGTRGENPLICVGINPSTARPGALDPTLKSVERVAKSCRFRLVRHTLSSSIRSSAPTPERARASTV